MSSIAREMGARLKDERERLGHSQIDFAAMCGISKTSLGGYERGETSPNMMMMMVFADFGVDPVFVMTGRKDYSDISAGDRYIIDMLAKLSERERGAVASLLMHLTGNLVTIHGLGSGAHRDDAFSTLQEQSLGYKAPT